MQYDQKSTHVIVPSGVSVPQLRDCIILLGLVLTLILKANPNAQCTTPHPEMTPTVLNDLSLAELSQIEVTTPSKLRVTAFLPPAAIIVITGEEIRRSGVITIPTALRLAPGVEVAGIDSSKWSIGVRRFGSRLTQSVLALIEGRTVYTPLTLQLDPTYRYVSALLGRNLFLPSHPEYGTNAVPLIGITRSVYARMIWRG